MEGWWHSAVAVLSLKHGCRLGKPKHWLNPHKSPPAQYRCKKGALNSGSCQHIGKTCGGNTTKIHAVVDGLGNPVYFQLSKGNINDNVLAIDILSHVDLAGANVLGDKAYGTLEIRRYITEKDAVYTIPPKTNAIDPWPCDWWVYKERHLVEGFFNKLKHFRRIAIRYDKLAVSFQAFLYVAAIFILSK